MEPSLDPPLHTCQMNSLGKKENYIVVRHFAEGQSFGPDEGIVFSFRFWSNIVVVFFFLDSKQRQKYHNLCPDSNTYMVYICPLHMYAVLIISLMFRLAISNFQLFAQYEDSSYSGRTKQCGDHKSQWVILFDVSNQPPPPNHINDLSGGFLNFFVCLGDSCLLHYMSRDSCSNASHVQVMPAICGSYHSVQWDCSVMSVSDIATVMSKGCIL